MFKSTTFLTALAITAFCQASYSQDLKDAKSSDIIEVIQKLYGELEGRTGTITGAIGKVFGDQLYIKNQSGMYEVVFDAGREARKKIENCSLELFGWENSECKYEFEIEYDVGDISDIADGIDIKLIVISLRDVP